MNTTLGDLYEEYDNALTIQELGRLGEEASLKSLIENGYTIVGTQVRVKTPIGLRIMDYITLKDGHYLGVEVKVNSGWYSTLQRKKDNLIFGGNGISIGYLNPEFPYESRIPPMPTQVQHVQCRLVPLLC